MSPIPKLLTHSSNSVTKLTDKKIRWIIKEKTKEILSTNDIALLQNVSESRIRQIWCHYRIAKTVPILGKPGRPSRIITNEEISAVIGTYKEYPCSAVVLETILDNRHGIKIPHNRIHKILKDHRLASDDSNKQRRRKWVKYERKHSMSLWHTDWYLIDDDRWRGKWLIAYLDDASRFVVGYGMFDESTTYNAISVLDDCIARYGKPLEILTDHGSQFYANSCEIKAAAISTFQRYLVGRKINHILGRVHHPQTNGKIERFYETFQSKIEHFNSMEEFVTWYNTKRPHMSLNWDELETPIQAFYRKIDRRRRLPFMINNSR
jgi:putative transposase